MGNRQRTIQNLQVVAADEDRGLIFIKGGLPGSKGSWISLKDAVKKALPSDAPYPAGLKGANNSKNEDDKSNQTESSKLEESPVDAPKEEITASEEAPKEASAKAEVPKEENPAEEAPTEASDQLKNDGKKEKEN